MANVEQQKLRNTDPLQVTINVTQELANASLISAADAELVIPRIEQFRRARHSYEFKQLVSDATSLHWLVENGKIDEKSYSAQWKALMPLQWYSISSFGGFKNEDLRNKEILPDFIINGIDAISQDGFPIKGMRQSLVTVKELPIYIKPFEPNSAANTVNALVPSPITLEQPDVLINFESEDIKTSIYRIARLVSLDNTGLRRDGYNPLTGREAYNTLLALLVQYDYIKRSEYKNSAVLHARAHGIVGGVFLGMGGALGASGISLALNGYVVEGSYIGLVGALPGVMGGLFLALGYTIGQNVGLRRVFGLQRRDINQLNEKKS